MRTLRQSLKRLHDRWLIQTGSTVSVKDLNQRYQPIPAGSMKSLLAIMNNIADMAQPVGGSHHPYYRRIMPTPQKIRDFSSDTSHIDLTHAHMEPYGVSDPVAEANRLFDARAAAAVSNAAGVFGKLRISPFDPPEGEDLQNALLEFKFYRDDDGDFLAPSIYIPKGKCLAVMAYPDYFPEWGNPHSLRRLVSDAIMAAHPGWCGTFGPGVDGAFDVAGNFPEGNYDMSEMHLLQIAYRYYDELSPAAQDLLIEVLLATGTVHRPGDDDVVTSGRVPEDWSRAGFVSPGGIHVRIGETENHILMIHTARYLTNQLLYQRDPTPDRDNRNNSDGRVSCMELLLYLLRNILRDDFCEYNAKPYQTETRSALLNLCSYAYDHEVRLAALMALDYISAHIAVSSCDLRRMVPFRRLNKDEHVTRLFGVDHDFMDVGLLEPSLGADPMAEPYAIQAGNTRAYANPNLTPLPSDNRLQARPWSWAIAGDGGAAVAEALSDYRLPPLIHDLFVNDSHRRFYQKLHRVTRFDETEGASAMDDDAKGISGRNADNMEIYAGSPSYLITAGGAPGPCAIDPGPAGIATKKGREKNIQQVGVAVPTSFMPTGHSAGSNTQNGARDLIQFGAFSHGFSFIENGKLVESSPPVANYGVAPDFACGHKVHLPLWVLTSAQLDGQFLFVDKGSPPPLPGVVLEPPGFYLAIFNDGEFPFLEAFDTWLHPGVKFQDFKAGVKKANPNIKIENNVECQYTTQNGNRVRFVIWKDGKRENDLFHGARILGIDYSDEKSLDAIGDASKTTDQFLHGTILNSLGEAVIEITNHDKKITLDMSDPNHPKRTSETRLDASETHKPSVEVEQAGFNNEVWVNFGWKDSSEGDFFHPFATITAAAAKVAEGGVIKIMPGWTTERPLFQKGKRIRIVAPIGGVTFGIR